VRWMGGKITDHSPQPHSVDKGTEKKMRGNRDKDNPSKPLPGQLLLPSIRTVVRIGKLKNPSHSIRKTDLVNTLHALPKIDLHRHLEGSLRLETLAEIAHQHGIDLPRWDIEELRPYVQIVDDQPDFHSFLAKFALLRRFYSSREAVERVAYEAVADAAADNVKYLELRFNPVALAHAQGFSYSEVADWTCSAVKRAENEHEIKARLIVQIGREESVETAWQLAEVAIAHKDQGVVGLDLAGDELHCPASPFAQVFQDARAAGLHVTIHAGEAGSAWNVREAVELMGADRIGHGVKSAADLGVIDLLKSRGTALEMCPTSNIQTGVVKILGHHPLRPFHQIGLKVTINTDDPSISNTTLTTEYLIAITGIEMRLQDIRQTIQNSAEASFLPPEERAELVEWFRQALSESAPLATDEEGLTAGRCSSTTWR
jgi:adenosine deaminase